jgi:hypothetical protein
VKFEEGGNVSVQKVQSTSAFQFTTSISVVKRQNVFKAQLTMDSHKTHKHYICKGNNSRASTEYQNKDFFSSLINQFNLIIKPEEGNLFYMRHTR